MEKIEEAETKMLSLFEEDLNKKISDITGKKGW
jgi:hypothetical protein